MRKTRKFKKYRCQTCQEMLTRKSFLRHPSTGIWMYDRCKMCRDQAYLQALPPQIETPPPVEEPPTPRSRKRLSQVELEELLEFTLEELRRSR